MFKPALFALLASTATSSFVPNGDIAATSELGMKLLNKATVVEHARHLDQNERDVTFVASYSIRYLGCSSLIQVNAGEGNNNNNGDGGILYTQNLVRFALCPTDNCNNSCSGGGEYVVSMNEFVDLYTEFKLTEKEYNCEIIRENCYCGNQNDDEVCEASCYTTAGMSECIEYEGQEEFEVQRYLECQEIEGGNNNNNNGNGNYYANNGEYYGMAYVGVYCNPNDGKSIHLGIFYDQYCSTKGDDEIYAKRMYGVQLPFARSTGVSLVSSNCISCTDAMNDNNNNNNNNGNNNNNQDVEIIELCEQSYESAARCEESMNIQYKDTSGCDYIKNILPRLESASMNVSTKGSGSSGAAGKAFAVIFAFTTVLFAGYAYFLYRKIKRGSINLAGQE